MKTLDVDECAGCGARDALSETEHGELACPYCGTCDWCGDVEPNGCLFETRDGELKCVGCS